MPDRMMDQQMMDPTAVDLGTEVDQETVVVIAGRPDGTFVVEGPQGEQEAMSLDEALAMARTALGGDPDPMAMREEVAGEVYPEDGM